MELFLSLVTRPARFLLILVIAQPKWVSCLEYRTSSIVWFSKKLISWASQILGLHLTLTYTASRRGLLLLLLLYFEFSHLGLYSYCFTTIVGWMATTKPAFRISTRTLLMLFLLNFTSKLRFRYRLSLKQAPGAVHLALINLIFKHYSVFSSA